MCQKYRHLNSYKHLINHEMPKEFWAKIYLVVNYTSKHFKLTQLPNASSYTVITLMKSILARYDTPKLLISDNWT